MSGATHALVVTLVVEVPIVFAFYRTAKSIGVAFAINVLTNSLLNRVWLVHGSTFELVTGELASFAVEAFVYARVLGRERAIAASATANLASFLLAPLALDYGLSVMSS